MTEKDLIYNLQQLKNVQPNTDWAVFARHKLISRIQESDHRTQRDLTLASFIGFFTPVRLFFGLALSVVALMVLSTVAAQRSLPGSPFYNVKLAFEGVQTTVTPGDERKLDLRANFTARRVQEVSELASHKLDVQHIAVVSEKLNSYRDALEAQTEDTQALFQKVAVIEEQARALTVAISESTDSVTVEENLRGLIVTRMEACSDEVLRVEITELLEAGDVASLIDAHELSLSCGSTSE